MTDTIQKAAMALGGGLITLGIVVLGIVEILAGYVFTLRTQQRGQPEPVKSSRCLGKLA